MANIIPIKRSWGDQKPPLGTPFNSGHSLSEGLQFSFLLNDFAGVNVSDDVNKLQGTINNYGNAESWQPDGVLFDADNGSNASEYIETNIPSSYLVRSTQPFSIAYGFKRVGLSPNQFEYYLMGSATFSTFAMHREVGGTSTLFRYATDSLSWDSIDPFDADPTGRHSFVVSVDSAANARVVVDGKDEVTAALTPSATPELSLKIGGRHNAVARYSNGIFEYLYYWNRIITLDECAQLHDFQYSTYDTVTYIDIGSATGTTIDATKGNSNAAAVDPTVSVGTTIAATKGNANAAAVDPTVSVGTTIEAAKGNANAVSINPTISVGTTIGATEGATEIASINPEIVLSTTIDATKGNANVASINPVVSAGVTIEATKGAAEVASINPEVDLGVVISPTKGAAEVASINPTVEAGTTIAPTKGAAIAAAINPAISLRVDINSTLGEAVVSAINPSVIATAGIFATTGRVTLAAINPSLVIGVAPPTPLERTMLINAENRVMAINDEDRALLIKSENRTLAIGD